MGSSYDFITAFWERVDRATPAGPAGDCWEWQGVRRDPPWDYGVAWVGPRAKGFPAGLQRAHRIAYEMCHGPIPDGLVVRHSCDHPPCCNPDHLLLGTPAANSADMTERQRQNRWERNGHAKLSREKVLAIRARRADGERGADLAREFGVHPRTIRQIVQGRTWRGLVA